MEEVKRTFDVPYYQLKKYPKQDALCDKVGGQWVKHSLQEYLDNANAMSRGLLAMGIKPGDKIAMISNNRSEWNMADIGIAQVGAISVPVYPTISESDYKFIFNDAEVKLCIVSDEDLYTKITNIIDDVPSLTDIYTFENIQGAKHWTAILEKGNQDLQSEVEKRMKQVKEEDLVTLIYTSGTTGTPKGVMLNHKNLISNAKGCRERLPVDSTGKALSFLPVCHVYERMLLYLYQLAGVSIYFAESLDTIGDNLKEVKPQVFTAVPRLLEKVYDKIIAKGNDLSGIKKKLFFWAVELGHEYDVNGKSAWYKLKLGIARKIIFSKWQEALGGNAKAVASGSAALQPRLARVYLAAGIPVMEGYGLTETSPVVSVNCEEKDGVRIGTVGRVLRDVEVKIAEDGEILVKGPNVMLGYYNQPEKTKEVLTNDGWFHTGDIGTFVDGDFLKITDRKKEIFKTSGGKYIAPQVMENKFKESSFIEQIMVVGEGEKHPAALIVPSFHHIQDWSREEGFECKDRKSMCENPLIEEKIWDEVKQLNQEFGHWEQVKKIELCIEEWSIEGGELTPTLKLKRKKILEKYQSLMNKIYRS